MLEFWITIAVFIATYLAIIFESYLKIHRTVFALSGAILLIAIGVISQSTEWSYLNHLICGAPETISNGVKEICQDNAVSKHIKGAVDYIDWNTLGLLAFMMIVVGILKTTGLFEYISLFSVLIARGNLYLLMVIYSVIIAVVSAFIDNVTTIILMSPVILSVCRTLKIDFVPFFIVAAIASNIGGTATLVGDPPNILIGSQVELSFMDFVRNLTFPIVLALILNIVMFRFVYRKSFKISDEIKEKAKQVSLKGLIKNPTQTTLYLLVLGLVLTGFVLHDTLHLEVATIAGVGAVLLMLISRVHPEEILKEIEWPALFFFVGLFIIIGSLEKVGVLEMIAKEIMNVTSGDLVLAMYIILWFSAIASAFVDNIPFVATMIPLIKEMAAIAHPELSGVAAWHSPDFMPLWWALSLGACLGGNGTLIGASANVVIAGIAEREGRPITFIDFTKVAFPLMIITIAFLHGYIYLFGI